TKVPSGAAALSGASVVAAAIDLRSIAKSFSDRDIPHGTVLSLLDRQNRIIARFPSDTADIGAQIPLPAGLDAKPPAGDAHEVSHPDGPMLIAPVRDIAGGLTGYHVVLSVNRATVVAAANARWRVY